MTGAQKALQYGIDPVMAAVLGMVSGIGGGMMRDLLAGDVPTVLRADLYALAALAAAGIVSLGQALGARPLYPMLFGAAACVFLRLMAIYRGWRFPVPPGMAPAGAMMSLARWPRARSARENTDEQDGADLRQAF